jgi:hypothetical protein
MNILRAASISLEVAHHSPEGVLHGHSLMVEAWTPDCVCLDAWKAEMTSRLAVFETGPLEATAGRTFEDVAIKVLELLPSATRVIVRLPSRGHAVEVTR